MNRAKGFIVSMEKRNDGLNKELNALSQEATAYSKELAIIKSSRTFRIFGRFIKGLKELKAKEAA